MGKSIRRSTREGSEQKERGRYRRREIKNERESKGECRDAQQGE